VKRLFDQNLSPVLVRALDDLHSGSLRVRDVDLHRALDAEIWTHAIEHGYAIVSKDLDFAERALVQGPPPKVIWIRLGNCSTADVEALLREHDDSVRTFASDDTPVLALA